MHIVCSLDKRKTDIVQALVHSELRVLLVLDICVIRSGGGKGGEGGGVEGRGERYSTFSDNFELTMISGTLIPFFSPSLLKYIG